MEFLMSNLDVMDDVIGNFEDDYLIFDCPGAGSACLRLVVGAVG